MPSDLPTPTDPPVLPLDPAASRGPEDVPTPEPAGPPDEAGRSSPAPEPAGVLVAPEPHASDGARRPDAEPHGRSGRFRDFWHRHRRLFWTIHSAWALATGVAVILLARERYGFVPWVVLFMALTWVSTLFFGRSEAVGSDAVHKPGLGHELTSYLTRGLYQETLYFLLPFYAYSTVVRSPNVVFLLLLGGLAVFSSLDLLFDRLLRTSPVFGLVFFATVAFAATNLVLPMLVAIRPLQATVLAGLIAVGTAAPLALRAANGGWGRAIRMVGAGAVILGVAVWVPSLVPPVPLRLEDATFSSGIDRETLELADSLTTRASVAELNGVVVVLARVFAPSDVPTRVTLEWKRDGETFRTSREIEILAHDIGFRVWDSWRPDDGTVPPGRYEVVLTTAGHRVFGVARLVLVGAEPG